MEKPGKKIAKAVFGSALGISLIFLHADSSAESKRMMSSIPPHSEKVMSKPIEEKSLERIVNKVNENKYIDKSEMAVIVENCSQDTPEDAALCFLSGLYLKKEDILKRVVSPKTSAWNLGKLILGNRYRIYNDTVFKLKPVRYIDGEFVGKIEHYKNPLGEGELFGWFVKENGKWFLDLNRTFESYPKNKDFLKYTTFLQKRFASRLSAEYEKMPGEWIEIPSKDVEKFLKE